MLVGRGVGTGVEVAPTLPEALAGTCGLLDSTGESEVSGADAVGDAGTGGLAGVAGAVQAIKNKLSSTRIPHIMLPVIFRLVGVLVMIEVKQPLAGIHATENFYARSGGLHLGQLITGLEDSPI
jgi:hypothetical protein